MLRRTYRPTVPGNFTKRPTGGRPNPCALHRSPRHPLSTLTPDQRAQNLRDHLARRTTRTACVLFSEAIQSGLLPVGLPIREGHIRRVIGKRIAFQMENLALQLAASREPVRLRQIDRNHWIASLR